MVVLIKGREDISSLVTSWRIGVVVLIGLAVSAAVIAIYLAALAAQGEPESIDTTATSFKKWYTDRLNKAARNLTWSRYTTIVAVVALALAIGTAWLAPTERPSQTNAIVVKADGAASCGQITTVDGQLYLKFGDEDVVPLPLDSIVNVIPVAKCP
jgi:hypothetical protein